MTTTTTQQQSGMNLDEEEAYYLALMSHHEEHLFRDEEERAVYLTVYRYVTATTGPGEAITIERLHRVADYPREVAEKLCGRGVFQRTEQGYLLCGYTSDEGTHGSSISGSEPIQRGS